MAPGTDEYQKAGYTPLKKPFFRSRLDLGNVAAVRR
jgi:hypothetical protein